MRIALERGAVTAERIVPNAKADPVMLRAAKRLGWVGADNDVAGILAFMLERLVGYIVAQAGSQELQETRDASTINLDP